MAKKYPSELNTRTIRIGIGDYALLIEVSRRAGVTMAEALHLALEQQEAVAKVPQTQLSMVGVRVTPAQVTTWNRVIPRRVTGNGTAHIEPKRVREA
jgi:hypothetical protein